MAAIKTKTVEITKLDVALNNCVIRAKNLGPSSTTVQKGSCPYRGDQSTSCSPIPPVLIE